MFGNMQDKMMQRFFRKIDNCVWDLMSGSIGIATPDGIVTLSGEGDDAQVELNLLDQFGMPVPAYAQSTPLVAVTVGDLVYGAGKPKGWVTAVRLDDNDAPKRFQLMTPSGTTTTWTPPKVSMLGFDSGVMVVRSLISMLPGGKGGLGNMQSMLMPMLMMGGGDLDFDAIMPMMLFSQVGASGDGSDANPMMGNNMMQTMLMMQMMGGKKGKGNNGRAANPLDKIMSGKTGFFDQEDV